MTLRFQKKGIYKNGKVNNMVHKEYKNLPRVIPMWNLRHEIFECRSCGAYEDIFPDGARRTFLKGGAETNKEFIVVKDRQYTRRREKTIFCSVTYRYICGVCGIYQSERFSNSFSV